MPEFDNSALSQHPRGGGVGTKKLRSQWAPGEEYQCLKVGPRFSPFFT